MNAPPVFAGSRNTPCRQRHSLAVIAVKAHGHGFSHHLRMVFAAINELA
jgi:hypothetical protein